ncbi:MAG: histidine kinase [Bacteroidetes bacterium]|nr:histidine kinase [Bacteroidota bacterium]
MRLGIVLFFLMIMFRVCAQDKTTRLAVYSTQDGLSNGQVNCVLNDSRGYLWVGTAEGLNRFDGRQFRSFYADRTDPNSLSGNFILDLLEVKPGELFIATNNGLAVLNTFTNTFLPIHFNDTLLQRGHGMVISNLFKDQHHHIWINYNGKIAVFDESYHFLYNLTDQAWAAALQGIKIYYESCITDGKGRVWAATDNMGVCIINEEKHLVEYYGNNPAHYPFMSKGAVRSMLLDEAHGKFYYGLWGKGLQVYDFTAQKTRMQHFNLSLSTDAGCINAITLLKNGRLLCAGGKAVYTVDTSSLDYQVINQTNGKQVMPDYYTSGTAYTDHIGNCWIGTFSFGLLEIPATAPVLQYLSLPASNMLQGYYPNCTDAIQKGNVVYMAYNLDGVMECDIKKGTVMQHHIASPGGNRVDAFRLCRIDSNNFWIGTGLGIYTFNMQDKKVSVPAELPDFVKKLDISAMANDQAGNQWIATTDPNAISYYDRQSHEFHYYRDYIVNGVSCFNKDYKITAIKTDADGNVWMTSDVKGGFLCYHSSTKQWEAFPYRGSANYVLFNGNGVADFVSDTGHIIWLAFYPGTGLVKYNYATDKIEYIDHKNGLLSDNISSIEKDQRGNLMLLNSSGINYYDKTNRDIQTHIFTNAERNWSRLYYQFYSGKTDEILYPVSDKIMFTTNDFPKVDTGKIVVDIEDVVSLQQADINYTPGGVLELNHSESSFSLSLAASSLEDEALISFAYMLQGFDKGWTITDNARSIAYKNLSPGAYHFMAKAKKHNGDWGTVNESLMVVIKPEFWETWWFWLLCSVVTIGLVFWLIQNRIRSIKYRAELKQKIVATEMAALQAQMNPHFIFNCLNAIDNLIQTNQGEKATTYLARFARLIRSVLDGTKQNVIPFQRDFEMLQLYLQMEQFRSNDKFTYLLQADDELMHSDFKIPAMVIQPFVENAIIHGLLNKQEGERKLKITAKLEYDNIVYTIIDNGVGREKAMEIKLLNKPEHQSEGIRISRERLQLFNKTEEHNIEITDLQEHGQPSGTQVMVRIICSES